MKKLLLGILLCVCFFTGCEQAAEEPPNFSDVTIEEVVLADIADDFSGKIEITSRLSAGDWKPEIYYTYDGTEPTESSNKYPDNYIHNNNG